MILVMLVPENFGFRPQGEPRGSPQTPAAIATTTDMFGGRWVSDAETLTFSALLSDDELVCEQCHIFHSVQSLKHAPVKYATPYRRFKLASANQLFGNVRIRLEHHEALMKKFCRVCTILTSVHCLKTMESFDRQIASEVYLMMFLYYFIAIRERIA